MTYEENNKEHSEIDIHVPINDVCDTEETPLSAYNGKLGKESFLKNTNNFSSLLEIYPETKHQDNIATATNSFRYCIKCVCTIQFDGLFAT